MQTQQLTYQFLNNTTFVMGNRKHAGKTTFLNWVLNQIRQVESPAFGSIGVDGESHDQIDGRTKPRVYAHKGDGIVTSLAMIKKSDGLFSIEKALPINTPLGQLVIAKTLRGGRVELIGPEHNEQLQMVIKHLKDELQYKTIVFDGAASRLTPVSAVEQSGFYYVMNIDRRNLTKAVEQMQLLTLSSQLKTMQAAEQLHPLDGALTKAKLSQLPKQCEGILINDLSSVFLSYQQLAQLMKNSNIRVKQSIKLKGFVIITKDVAQEAIKAMLQSKNIQTKIIYNPYVHQ